MYRVALNQLQNGDADNPATKRALLGFCTDVQTTIQTNDVDISSTRTGSARTIESLKQAKSMIRLGDYY